MEGGHGAFYTSRQDEGDMASSARLVRPTRGEHLLFPARRRSGDPPPTVTDSDNEVDMGAAMQRVNGEAWQNRLMWCGR